MRGYGQFCPVAKAAELFCERWTALILRDLASGATRFSELQRGVPTASPTLLARRLHQLEAEGIVERRSAGSRRGWTYHLTPAGRDFGPVIEGLGIWGQRWARRELAAHELDLKLLLWGLERSVRPNAFGERRCVVRMTFADQPVRVREWWFVNDGGQLEMCKDDPGFDVDLYLEATLPTMIRVYRGDVTLAGAIEQGGIQVTGLAWARRALSRWLLPGPLAEVKSMRSGLPAEARGPDRLPLRDPQAAKASSAATAAGIARSAAAIPAARAASPMAVPSARTMRTSVIPKKPKKTLR